MLPMLFRKKHITLNGPLEKFYSIGHVVGRISGAVGYQVYDKKAKNQRVLWITERPLDDTEKHRFCERVKALGKSSGSPVSDVGFDDASHGFVILKKLAVKKINFGNPSIDDLSVRFLKATLTLKAIHDRGIVCGNLSDDCFMLDAQKNLYFAGVAGEPEGGGGQGYEMFRAPEQALGAQATMSSDVYALAVVGLKLFGASFPSDEIQSDDVSSYLKTLSTDMPAWLQAVLPKVILNPEKTRVKNASELLSAISIQAAHERQLVESGGASFESTVKARSDAVILRSVINEAITFTKLTGVLRGVLMRPLIASILLVAGIGMAGYWLATRWMATPEAPLVARSPAPGARLIVEGPDSSEMERLKIAQETDKMPVNELTPLAISTDRTLSQDERMNAAIRLEQINPDRAYQIAADMSLGSAEDSVSKSILMRGATKANGFAKEIDLTSFSTAGLLASISSTRQAYLNSFKTGQIQIPSLELWFLLDNFAAQRLSGTRQLAEIAEARELSTWPRSIFLRIIQIVEMTLIAPVRGLVKLARFGAKSQDDVVAISDWLDSNSLGALYAILADEASPPAVIDVALDALEAKPFTDPRVGAMLDLLRAKDRNIRRSHAALLGNLGLSGMNAPARLDESIGRLASAGERDVICLLLLKLGGKDAITSVLNRYGNALNPNILVDYLSTANPDLRLALIPFAKNASLLSARTKLTQAYIQEKDPQIKAAYKREIPNIGGGLARP